MSYRIFPFRHLLDVRWAHTRPGVARPSVARPIVARPIVARPIVARPSVARLLVGCLLLGCNPSTDDLESIQHQNIQLIKQLYQRLNNHNWKGAARLYANPVNYKGAATQFAELPYRPAQLIAFYQNQELTSQPPGPTTFEITQLYPVYTHQVVAELRPIPAGPRPICQIYTIENSRITRQYTY